MGKAKQRKFYLDDDDWKKLQSKIEDNGFEGKGKLERFMELIARERFFVLKGKGVVKISIK